MGYRLGYELVAWLSSSGKTGVELLGLDFGRGRNSAQNCLCKKKEVELLIHVTRKTCDIIYKAE